LHFHAELGTDYEKNEQQPARNINNQHPDIRKSETETTISDIPNNQEQAPAKTILCNNKCYQQRHPTIKANDGQLLKSQKLSFFTW
jgi:hypothetical protein